MSTSPPTLPVTAPSAPIGPAPDTKTRFPARAAPAYLPYDRLGGSVIPSSRRRSATLPIRRYLLFFGRGVLFFGSSAASPGLGLSPSSAKATVAPVGRPSGVSYSRCISITATAATRSRSTSISVTPCVERSCFEMCSIGVRRTMPSSEISISSWLGFTIRAAISSPVFGVVLNVRTPCPPRPCLGYSSTCVRLPNPNSLTTNSASAALAISIPTMRSPEANLIPRTPPERRELEQLHNRLAARLAGLIGDFIRLNLEAAAAVGEEDELVMRIGDD